MIRILIIFFIWHVILFLSVGNKFYEMNEIVVESEKKIQSDPLEKTYSLDDYSNQPITDVGDIVKKIPGVSIPFDISASDNLVPYSNRGFSAFRIRGLGGNYVSLTIDGIRQPPQYQQSGGMGRTFFDPSIYESVSIRKSTGSSSSQSDSVAGAINFNTFSDDFLTLDPSQRIFGSARTTYNSASDSINGLFKIKDRIPNQETTIKSSLTFGNERKNKKGNIPADPMNFSQKHHLIGVKKRLNNKTIFFNVEHYDYRSSVDFDRIETYEGTLTDSSPKVDFSDSRNQNQRNRINIKLEESIESKIVKNMSLNAYFQESSSKNKTREREIQDPYFGISTGFNNVERATEVNDILFENDLFGIHFESQNEVTLFDQKLDLKAGFFSDIEDGNNDFKRFRIFEASELAIENGVNPITTTEQDPPNYMDPSKLYRNELYLDSDLKKKNLNLQVGIRYADYKIKPQNNSTVLDNSMMTVRPDYKNRSLIKSTSISHNLPAFKQHLSFSEGVRNPSLENYSGYFTHGDFINIPNPNLKPEEAVTLQYNVYKNFSLFDVDFTIFNSDYDNFFETVSTGTNSFGNTAIEERQIINIAESYIRGVETDCSLYLKNFHNLLDGFIFNFKYADYKSKNKNTNQSLDAVTPKQYIFTLQYDHPISRFGGSILATHNAKKDNISDNWTYFVPPASTVVDLNTYYYFANNSLLRFSIRNLTDEKYWLWPNAGRVVHSFSEDKEFSTMPGINFILSYSMEL